MSASGGWSSSVSFGPVRSGATTRPQRCSTSTRRISGARRTTGRGCWSASVFARMAELQAGLKGAFIPTINGRPEIRDLFGGFCHEPVQLTYKANAGAWTAAGELIVTNREVRVGLL